MKTKVLVIGGGATGTGVARDLALRGIPCVLVEKGDIDSGASGRNHGLLHSGARYVYSDPVSAAECKEEGTILKRIAPHIIEDTGGIYAAVKGDDPTFIEDFQEMCDKCGISAERLTVEEALALEPNLSKDTIAAYKVEDASIDPFRLSIENMSDAKNNGAKFLTGYELKSFKIENKKIVSATVQTKGGKTEDIEPEIVINATGSWAVMITRMAGIDIDMVFSKGSLIVTQTRLSNMVLNRLRIPDDSDIIVPGGTVSIIGTTSERIDSPDEAYPRVEEVDKIVDEAAKLIPVLKKSRLIRVYSGVRPLIKTENAGSDRMIGRSFSVVDHEGTVGNFITITGGKLTTFRLMAEKAVDLACKKLGINKKCTTMDMPLPDSPTAKFIKPGYSAKQWLLNNDVNDPLLCECEMVSKSVVDSLIETLEDHAGDSYLVAMGLRSRATKGPCQGMFCSLRILSYMYDKGVFKGDEGLSDLKLLLNERWKGLHPLLWDQAMVQAELMEALHCGFLGTELE
ncbi:MAG: anaerobic glycerol-3-phosphate dehydrogenase subunit A [Desulfobacterales bacterium]|nr:anaerobic glycerol-3-phosphate dehydrogenase subunit A [Desulfobacterales bacterium]MCP4163200.1 anaerobic glycerol-3-phosphate dehydrogenase subunit A [Deltaproteobacteria bacterium]